MSNGMTHDEAREALGALALDALDASERAAVLAHVAECASCRDELAALRETAASLTHIVEPVPMPDEQRDRVRARLLARAAAERAQQEKLADDGGEDANTSLSAPGPVLAHAPNQVRVIEPHQQSPRNVASRVTPASPPLVLRPAVVPQNAAILAAHRMEFRARWLAAAAIVVAVGSVWALIGTREERDDMKVQLQLASVEARADGKVLDSLRAGVASRDRMLAGLTGPDVAVVTLAAVSPHSPSGRMFWDQAVSRWTFVAHNMPQPHVGRAYQLWLVTAKEKISAGTFSPNGAGDALVVANYPLPRGDLAGVAVTDEPTEGSRQPTTTAVIAGSARGR